jgi:aryl-alcohol dehydrogenase-like predicted oxidoreductase
VAQVQNLFNITARADDHMVDSTARQGVAYVPFFPLGSAFRPLQTDLLAEVARRHDASPHQIALAWLLARSPVILPIPGTSQVAHLEENCAAALIRLTDAEMARLT